MRSGARERRRARAFACAFALSFVAGCASSDDTTPSSVDPTSSTSGTTPASPSSSSSSASGSVSPSSDHERTPPAPPLPLEPACTKPPCAERPIIFVHGFQGSFDDFVPMMKSLVATDGRWDSYEVSGIDDAKAWAPSSIPRRSWLFAFDYYLKKSADGRGSYSAGPGRIGADREFQCAAPFGAGKVMGDNGDYDDGVTHEYSQDLADFVARVQAATGARRIDFVAHSMGGLVVRSYLSEYGGAAITNRTLLLSSPVRGVGLIGFLEIYPLTGGPDWQSVHEVAELDSGTILSKVSFRRCGDEPTDKASFGMKLQQHELSEPLATELYVMSGGSDILVSYDAADHPLEKFHQIVNGADHSGMLKADESRQRASELLGGTY
jgi:pimeloyl-ACP methyl ester carboxylesterase